jgi:hypothetical protein
MAPGDNTFKDPEVPYATGIIIGGFLAIAIYNSIELVFIIITAFKKRSGLYFWSFIFATLGIAVHGIGFLLQDFKIVTNSYLSTTLIMLGWYPMVTGQSIVLYSRLHLIVRNQKRLRAVLIMIICNAIIGHLPTTVLIYGSNSNNPTSFLGIYNIYEKIQVTLFFIQEVILSGLYIYETTKILRVRNIDSGSSNGNINSGNSNRKMMRHLLGSNILIILLDLTILALEFCDLYSLQTAYKGAAYSIKLKLEFNILNRLIEVVKPGHENNGWNQYSSERDGTAQLQAMRSRKAMRQNNTRDTIDHGHKTYIYAEEDRDLSAVSGLGSTNKTVLKTTEIMITTEGKAIPRQRTTSCARSDMSTDSAIPTEDAAHDMRSSSSQKEFARAGF